MQLCRPGWGKKGYATVEVDAFLGRAVEALTALALRREPQLSADEVQHVRFRTQPFGRGRGYDEDQVDALLDRLEQTFRSSAA
ncbi:DivIVA domain-containing protein [Blastococcus aurantiacus]|uniref:DivIVA domain-containing protein n=1 Tax=Blastococcus aurantiacus TaxID=1550231 RepID=UPI001C40B9EF|nr:DivIVA domain-containing protein [Blastococcus aurantiacus]